MAGIRRTSFYRKMREAYTEAYDSGNQELVTLLTDVISYVGEGSFVNSGSYKDFYRVVYDSPDEAARALSVSDNAYRARLKSMSDKLYALFGDDFFTIIEGEDGAQIGAERLRLVNQDVKTQFMPGVISQFSKGMITGSYSMDDLSDEIAFIKLYTTANFEAMSRMLDPSKLAYIARVFTGDVGDVNTRLQLSKLVGTLPEQGK